MLAIAFDNAMMDLDIVVVIITLLDEVFMIRVRLVGYGRSGGREKAINPALVAAIIIIAAAADVTLCEENITAFDCSQQVTCWHFQDECLDIYQKAVKEAKSILEDTEVFEASPIDNDSLGVSVRAELDRLVDLRTLNNILA
ncbi:hypothetical protein TruAng_006702 [Truncatella angustata]|nr:hypothetical protein TruAng_006702 [Truncatella angustata]